MWTAMIHHADLAAGVAERDQFFREQHQSNGFAVGDQFGRFERRDPIIAHQLAHGRARAGAGQDFIFGGGRHGDAAPVGIFTSL